MLSNSDVLEFLLHIQARGEDWTEVLDELVDTFEKAVAAEETEEPSPFSVVGSGTYDADNDRWEPAGRFPNVPTVEPSTAYRDLL